MTPPGFDPVLDRTIECSPRAPAEARRTMDDLAQELGADLLRDVQLVVSELVTNSVRHSGSDDEIRIRAWLRRSGLKVEIADGGCGFELGPGPPAHDDEGGRGLLILDALADRWGVSGSSRTHVWFEVGQRPVSGRRARAG